MANYGESKGFLSMCFYSAGGFRALVLGMLHGAVAERSLAF